MILELEKYQRFNFDDITLYFPFGSIMKTYEIYVRKELNIIKYDINVSNKIEFLNDNENFILSNFLFFNKDIIYKFINSDEWYDVTKSFNYHIPYFVKYVNYITEIIPYDNLKLYSYKIQTQETLNELENIINEYDRYKYNISSYYSFNMKYGLYESNNINYDEVIKSDIIKIDDNIYIFNNIEKKYLKLFYNYDIYKIYYRNKTNEFSSNIALNIDILNMIYDYIDHNFRN